MQKIKEWLFLFLLIIILCTGEFYIYSDNSKIVSEVKKSTILYVRRGPHEESFDFETPKYQTIPGVYLYRTGNEQALREYLVSKNSYLVNEPYFTEIVSKARKFNLNPCLLFAITGREQSFVPKNHKFAGKISNNPFNVFGSWEKYNTTISDSSEIVCRTIINLSKCRPRDVDFLKWINTQNGKGGYAEDVEWYKDVRFFFDTMNTKIY